MITALFLNLLITILGVIFVWLPEVKTLPTIGGFDIDAAFVTGLSYFNRILDVFWPIKTVMTAFLILMGYYGLKIIVRFFIGSRAPAH